MEKKLDKYLCINEMASKPWSEVKPKMYAEVRYETLDIRCCATCYFINDYSSKPYSCGNSLNKKHAKAYGEVYFWVDSTGYCPLYRRK